MTKQHKATPDDWAQQEDWANRSVFSDSSCIIELRDRLEALEATQQPRAFTGQVVAPIKAPITQDKLDRLITLDRDDPAGSLLDRVTWLIAKRFSESSPGTDCTPFGRAAILEVAAWLREQDGVGLLAATVLTREASR
jgi:hypothetical protein